MYSAQMIADSIMSEGHRLSTMEVVMPRIVLAEFNTHRMLSRNSASSRAIPFKRMVDMVGKSPFTPLKWMKEHTGMQGTEYLDDLGQQFCNELWLGGSRAMAGIAQALSNQYATKQICNRLLESFMWHKVLVSATEWENFFALRLHEAAEIHIQEVAKHMLNCLNNSDPKFLKAGEWHIPYGDQIDEEQLHLAIPDKEAPVNGYDEWKNSWRIKIATARCAQTSYTTIDAEGKPMDYAKLIALHDRLAASGHWSPFEHCAQAGNSGSLAWNNSSGWFDSNFRGFKQYRKFFKEENRTDSRLIKKEVPNGI